MKTKLNFLFPILMICLLYSCVGKEKTDNEYDSAAAIPTDSLKLEPEITEETSENFAWAKNWIAGGLVSKESIEKFGIENCFVIDTISDKMFSRINGVSFKEGCPVKRSDLRYIRLIHYDNEGNIKLGEIICNAKIAADIKELFMEFYKEHYALSSVRLIDDFNGDDVASMKANNTSCFNFRRKTAGSKLSKHAYGMAIDINPLYNPYIKKKTGEIQPAEGKLYLDRSKDFPYKIDSKDLAYKEFSKRGFKWGGSWRFTKDYQHFEK